MKPECKMLTDDKYLFDDHYDIINLISKFKKDLESNSLV